jgi:hypothetical protein
MLSLDLDEERIHVDMEEALRKFLHDRHGTSGLLHV